MSRFSPHAVSCASRRCSPADRLHDQSHGVRSDGRGRLEGQGALQRGARFGASVIVAREIKSYADLKGKTMAISTFGGFADKLSREILSQHGLVAMKDVMMLQIGTADLRYAALRSNKVQGTLLVGNYSITALEQGYRELDYQSPPYVSGPMIALDGTLARERALVTGFVRGVMKGHLSFRQRPEQAAAILQKALRLEDPKLAAQPHRTKCAATTPAAGWKIPI